MTARLAYEATLIELNKENAPNILLEDFNYFINKAINQYINKRYNIYDVNQQTTDDLRVLKATAILPVIKVNNYNDLSLASNATYETTLPSDYLHLLNCICIYNVAKTYKCYNQGDTWRAAATRLTADAYSQVLDNFWNRPTYKRPYYYIHNVNLSPSNPTNPYVGPNIPDNIDRTVKDLKGNIIGGYKITYTKNTNNKITETTIIYKGKNDDGITSTLEINLYDRGTDGTLDGDLGKDGKNNDIKEGTGVPTSIKIGGNDVSNIERGSLLRYGNVSLVRLEIRYGSDDSIFQLKNVYVDYIKAPQNIRLTQQQVDKTEDTSQMLEYPDYVCQEIINELVHIIMENISDLRILTHPVVSLSIANPAQALTEPAAQQQPT